MNLVDVKHLFDTPIGPMVWTGRRPNLWTRPARDLTSVTVNLGTRCHGGAEWVWLERGMATRP